MRGLQVLKFLTSSGLLLSMTGIAQAQEACHGIFQQDPAAISAINAQIDLKPLSPAVKKLIQNQLMMYASAILKVPVSEVLSTKKVSPLAVKDLGETGATPQELLLLKQLATLNDQSLLRPAIVKLLENLKSKADQNPQLAPLKTLSPEKEEYLLSTLVGNIEGLLTLRGLTAKSAGTKYLEWPELSQKMKARLDQSPAGLENIAHFANTKFQNARSIKLLVDGPESFAMRDSLIAGATKSIRILSWAFYADQTGFAAADLLIQKHQSGVPVQVMIDGQVAKNPGYREAIQKMEKAGVEVIRSSTGQHRKMIIVDNEHMIAGGLNFGDVYSHKNPDPSVARWRDTDIYVQGAPVQEGTKLFGKLWNREVVAQNLSYQKVMTNKFKTEPPVADKESVAILEHDPSKDSAGSTIMMTLLKGLREAKHSVEIENAYIILFPALKNEIQAAIARGVKVRVLTNSHLSVDEPIVSIPILRSAVEMASIGAEVYLRKGSTLHSKLAIFDGEYTVIMSYNLHPRSERVEGEMAILVKGKTFAAKVRSIFDSDIHSDKAIRVRNAEEIEVPESATALPVLRIFFDML